MTLYVEERCVTPRISQAKVRRRIGQELWLGQILIRWKESGHGDSACPLYTPFVALLCAPSLSTASMILGIADPHMRCTA